MTEPEQPTRSTWARAYARQALSDWETYELLAKPGASRCHHVHYLQMAAEKIAKAYRFRDTSTSPEQLLRHHVGFTKFIKAFLKSDHVEQMYTDKRAQLLEVSKHCRQLALELEKLAPAVDNLSLLDAPHGRTFLKLLKSPSASLRKSPFINFGRPADSR